MRAITFSAIGSRATAGICRLDTVSTGSWGIAATLRTGWANVGPDVAGADTGAPKFRRCKT
ncbi:hypothetical protein I551_1156 [Mycobacterium ulcerans str. Harvey]|uniref:Uncharacterized protein n=1 Tax=Mycobacterium ulcerans str. Harvey TaxID=1299332 RepID=A0ABN0R5P0_MYCUL|nr:hypothetical protein I551_1156 [Mycobacterium ulcerans str. Harvey]